MAQLAEIVKGLKSEDRLNNFESVQAVRRILACRDPQIDSVIQNNIVPYCIGFLTMHDHPDLQLEAAWALTNIASGNTQQVKAVVGAVPIFIDLLLSSDDKVAEQAVWALANISGDGIELRDHVLSFNVINNVITLLQSQTRESFLRNLAWFASNLCRHNGSHSQFNKIQPLIPHLVKLLEHSNDKIVADACWALSYITNDTPQRIQTVLNASAAQFLVNFLDSNVLSVLSPALRAVGNILAGNNAQTDAMLQCGVVARLNKLLKHSKTTVIKEATWAVSNIAAGTAKQIGQILGNDILQSATNVLKFGGLKCQKEAAWIVTNIITVGTTKQIRYLLENYIFLVNTYTDLLNFQDEDLIKTVLLGVSALFRNADKFGGITRLCKMFEDLNAVDKIGRLRSHQNREIRRTTSTLIRNHFSD